MLNQQKIIVVLPAFNAAATLEKTYREIPFDLVDEVVLVDDASSDQTLTIAKNLGIQHIIVHQKNKGYGGNQKSCYDKALSLNADIVIMLHPDYQYSPKLILSLANLIASGLYPVAMASRILGNGSIKGGMPTYKYVFNRILTLFQNLMLNQKLSEYHSGYRAFSAIALKTINYHANSDNFVFDNQMLVQLFNAGFEIAEVSCPTKYFKEASSINFSRSVFYGMGVIRTSFCFWLHKLGIKKYNIFYINTLKQ